MQSNKTSAGRLVESRLANATLLVVRAVLSQEIAAHVAEPLKSDISRSADTTIAWIIDDYCGTTVHSHRTPRPMPGPRGLDLALSLATFANVAAKSEAFRDELLKVAGRVTTKAYGA